MVNKSFTAQYVIKARDAFSKQANDAAKAFGKFNKQSGIAKKSAKALGNAFKVAGASIVGAITSVVFVGGKFETAMADMQAITGATGKDFNFLRNEALKLARDTVTSQTEVANVMKLVASAKPELLKNIPALTKMTASVLLLKNAVKNQRDKGNMLVFDETETAFCFENGTFINNYMPDVSILNGSLGVNAAVVKKDIEVNFNNLYIPSSLQLQRASEILRNLDGRRNPFSYIEKNVKQLNKSIENKITGYYGIYPVIKLGGELQRKALNEGFIISGNGVIFISSVHDEKLIHRFTNFLNKN